MPNSRHPKGNAKGSNFQRIDRQRKTSKKAGKEAEQDHDEDLQLAMQYMLPSDHTVVGQDDGNAGLDAGLTATEIEYRDRKLQQLKDTLAGKPISLPRSTIDVYTLVRAFRKWQIDATRRSSDSSLGGAPFLLSDGTDLAAGTIAVPSNDSSSHGRSSIASTYSSHSSHSFHSRSHHRGSTIAPPEPSKEELLMNQKREKLRMLFGQLMAQSQSSPTASTSTTSNALSSIHRQGHSVPSAASKSKPTHTPTPSLTPPPSTQHQQRQLQQLEARRGRASQHLVTEKELFYLLRIAGATEYDASSYTDSYFTMTDTNECGTVHFRHFVLELIRMRVFRIVRALQSRYDRENTKQPQQPQPTAQNKTSQTVGGPGFIPKLALQSLLISQLGRVFGDLYHKDILASAQPMQKAEVDAEGNPVNEMDAPEEQPKTLHVSALSVYAWYFDRESAARAMRKETYAARVGPSPPSHFLLSRSKKSSASGQTARAPSVVSAVSNRSADNMMQHSSHNLSSSLASPSSSLFSTAATSTLEAPLTARGRTLSFTATHTHDDASKYLNSLPYHHEYYNMQPLSTPKYTYGRGRDTSHSSSRSTASAGHQSARTISTLNRKAAKKRERVTESLSARARSRELRANSGKRIIETSWKQLQYRRGLKCKSKKTSTKHKTQHSNGSGDRAKVRPFATQHRGLSGSQTERISSSSSSSLRSASSSQTSFNRTKELAPNARFELANSPLPTNSFGFVTESSVGLGNSIRELEASLTKTMSLSLTSRSFNPRASAREHTGNNSLALDNEPQPRVRMGSTKLSNGNRDTGDGIWMMTPRQAKWIPKDTHQAYEDYTTSSRSIQESSSSNSSAPVSSPRSPSIHQKRSTRPHIPKLSLGSQLNSTDRFQSSINDFDTNHDIKYPYRNPPYMIPVSSGAVSDTKAPSDTPSGPFPYPYPFPRKYRTYSGRAHYPVSNLEDYADEY